MKERIVLYTLIFIVSAFTFYNYVEGRKAKHGFIINQKVFEGFKGKSLLEQRFQDKIKTHKHTLDSIANLINASSNDLLKEKYNDLESKFRLEEEEIYNNYSSDIWKQINLNVENFGREKGYRFIYGATGNGNLMYGDSTNDLTEEVINYINKKYEEGN
jgi:outer membrane protein